MLKRFYFDLVKRETILSDEAGIEAADLSEALEEAEVALEELRDSGEPPPSATVGRCSSEMRLAPCSRNYQSGRASASAQQTPYYTGWMPFSRAQMAACVRFRVWTCARRS